MMQTSTKRSSAGHAVRRAGAVMAVITVVVVVGLLSAVGDDRPVTAVAGQGSVLHVVASEGGDARGCPNLDPCTLAAALIQIPHADPSTISLAAGQYPGPLVIKQSVTIDGAAQGETIFNFNPRSSVS